MEHFLEEGQLAGKITCPNKKCAAKLGNYDWAGVGCGCKQWVTPVRCRCLFSLSPFIYLFFVLFFFFKGFCINRSKVDEIVWKFHLSFFDNPFPPPPSLYEHAMLLHLFFFLTLMKLHTYMLLYFYSFSFSLGCKLFDYNKLFFRFRFRFLFAFSPSHHIRTQIHTF